MTKQCEKCGLVYPGSFFARPSGSYRKICHVCYMQKISIRNGNKIDNEKLKDEHIKKFFEWRLSQLQHNNIMLIRETGQFMLINLTVEQLVNHYKKINGACEKTAHKMSKYGESARNSNYNSNVTIELLDITKPYSIDNIRMCKFYMTSVTFSPLEHIDQYIEITKRKLFNSQHQISMILDESYRLWTRSQALYICMFDADGNLRDFDEFIRVSSYFK